MGGDVDGNEKGFKRVLKMFLGFLLVLFVWLSFVAILASRKIEGSEVATSISPQNVRQTVLMGRGRHSALAKSDLINVSNRRVPSGPDPIHNRHVVKTRQPPGRA